MNDDLIITVDQDCLQCINIDSDDKYLLFKYFGVKHGLFLDFICLTQDWIEEDLQLLNHQIVESFDCSFGTFENFENDCFSLLSSGNVILINYGQCFLQYAITNKYYHFDKTKLLQILTRIFFGCKSFNQDSKDSYNFYCNLWYLLTQNKTLRDKYTKLMGSLVEWTDENLQLPDLCLSMDSCNHQGETFYCGLLELLDGS